MLMKLLRPLYPVLVPVYTLAHKYSLSPWNRYRNSGKRHRMLEIGPGRERIPGFETLNVVGGRHIDYIGDASKKLPFQTDTFDLIYSSHVLEHIPWYDLALTLKEWVRTLKTGGRLELWVPDGQKLCNLFCELDDDIDSNDWKDGWNPKNLEKNPYLWANGRLLYGARDDYPSWHKSVLTPNFLRELLLQAGLSQVELLTSEHVRGHDHGWINLGMKGQKP